MQTRSIKLLLVLSALFLAAACAQRETDVGVNAIPVAPDESEGKTFVGATRSAEWDLDLSPGRGAVLQVGEAQGFKVVSAVRFELAAILPDSFVIDTARIRFRVDQVYPGRGNAPDLRMLIKSVAEDWTEDQLKEDTLPNRSEYSVIDTILLTTAPLGAGDTLPPAVYWTVPDSILNAWITEDTLNHGILLEAENPNVIVGIQSEEGAEAYRIQLELVGSQFPEDSNFAETPWSQIVLPADDGYLATDLSDSLSGRLRVSQGSYRRALLYFPLDSMTVNPLRTVVRAWVHFYADLNAPNSLVYQGSNFLYKDASLIDTAWFAVPDSATQNFIALNSTAFQSDNRKISFEVTNSLVGMVGNPSTNGGFSIQASLESDILSRQYFHGHNSEVDSLRPQLEIWWVEP
ncbi:hypothetical protein HUU59_02585 [bacterium]|nr:hypothetical protein [bacterium]